MFFDTHVHFDDFVVDGSLESILRYAADSAVRKMLAVGGSSAANELSLKLAAEHPGRIVASVGYDRDLAGEPVDFERLREQAAQPQTVAIGEIGLDYFYEPRRTVAQKQLFSRCLEMANEVGKPIIVHTRDADEDTVGMLADFSRVWKHDSARIGVVHCYTRDEKMAKALLDLGFLISFSGIITFRNADSLREVAKLVPGDRILIETDSPYLAPVPHRGKRCEPAFVADTAARIAEVRGTSTNVMAEQTFKNATGLFLHR